MRSRRFAALKIFSGALVVMLCVVACSQKNLSIPTDPTAPASPAEPVLSNPGGVWRGTVTLEAVNDASGSPKGGCVAEALADRFDKSYEVAVMVDTFDYSLRFNEVPARFGACQGQMTFESSEWAMSCDLQVPFKVACPSQGKSTTTLYFPEWEWDDTTGLDVEFSSSGDRSEWVWVEALATTPGEASLDLGYWLAFRFELSR